MPEQRRGPSGVEYLRGIVTIPAVAIAAGATSAVTGTVTGAVPQSIVNACPRTALDAGLLIAWTRVSAADTVELGVMNPTAAPVTPTPAITVDVLVEPARIE